MRILVTGGAGFIGSQIAEAYLRQGARVAVADNLSSGKKANIHPKAEFYKVDIKSTGLETVFREFKPDIVNHHAAQIDVRRSVADPLFDSGVNIAGTINLLQNCAKYKTRKIIFASTGGAIYGEQEYFPADEAHPTNPLSPYGIAKLSAEHYMYYYKFNYGLDYIVLRYSNVYGPRQDPHGEAGVVAIFIQKLLKNEQPIINGSGRQTRDFVYVKDVVRANLLALKTKKNGIFNIGTSIETDINTIFKMLVKITGAKVKTIHGPAKPGEQKKSVITHKKAKRILGWKPEVFLEEGLRDTVEFFKYR
jgi:UDP-glucose 4-epimerase